MKPEEVEVIKIAFPKEMQTTEQRDLFLAMNVALSRKDLYPQTNPVENMYFTYDDKIMEIVVSFLQLLTSRENYHPIEDYHHLREHMSSIANMKVRYTLLDLQEWFKKGDSTVFTNKEYRKTLRMKSLYALRDYLSNYLDKKDMFCQKTIQLMVVALENLRLQRFISIFQEDKRFFLDQCVNRAPGTKYMDLDRIIERARAWAEVEEDIFEGLGFRPKEGWFRRYYLLDYKLSA